MVELYGGIRMKKQRETWTKPCSVTHDGNGDDYDSGDEEREGSSGTDNGDYYLTGSGSGIADGSMSSGYTGYGQGFETKDGVC